MAELGFGAFLVAVLLFILIRHWRLNRHAPMPNWPVVGMLPSILLNVSTIHDYLNSVLKLQGGTFMFEGPWLTGMNMLFTSDPMNVQHITSTKFENYGKGDNFREIFDVLGDGIFRSDSQLWKNNRAMLHSIFKQASFQLFFHRTIERKVDECLLPFLHHVWREGVHVDLQDAFQRLTLDNICSLTLGFDPNCLSIELPKVACEKAFSEVEETLFYRHFMPRFLWKLQAWLQVGKEKKYRENLKILHHMLHAEITSKRQSSDDDSQFDLLNALIREMKEGQKDDKFLRDTAINLLAAGRDTISAGLTWLFWLVATHPLVEARILEEIRENLPAREGGGCGDWKDLGVEGLNKLVYLHGAVCEALRLYPPVPYQHKCASNSDVLPSGHRIKPNTVMIFCPYSVGRVEEIWGEDCLKFKPERWISKRGGIAHVPSYKFIPFNAGPRSCLGKDMSFTEIKMIAAAVMWNYHIHVVDGHPISPSVSVVLHMKHGLKVRVTKRSV